MKSRNEIITRVAVAYEQLSRCHSELCRTIQRGDESESILNSFSTAINDILDIQVKLGVLRREEDL